MDFLFRGVASGLRGCGERDVGVAGYVEVEYRAFIGCGGAEGSDDDGGCEGLGGGEELDWEVFLGLWLD